MRTHVAHHPILQFTEQTGLLFTSLLIFFPLRLPRVEATEIHVPGDVPTIQGAINAATDGDAIIVAPGTYNESFDLLGKALVLRSSGGWNQTRLDGSSLGNAVVTCTQRSTLPILIQGFEITNGTGFSGCNGGGLYFVDSSITLQDCRIHHNEASCAGGAIFAHDGILTLDSCSIAFNTTDRSGDLGHGGGISTDDVELTIIGCTFEGNTAQWRGGALRHAGTQPCLILDSQFIGNASVGSSYGLGLAGEGGAISIEAPTDITDCTFSGNYVTHFGYDHNPRGGAVYVEYITADVQLTKCIFDGNYTESDGEGGALYLHYASANLDDCIFRHNTAYEQSGAVKIDFSVPVFTDCSFIENTAPYSSGAVCITGGRPQFDRCTFQGNSAEFAGALSQNSAAITFLTNCLFVGNSSGRGTGTIQCDSTTILQAEGTQFLENGSNEGGAVYFHDKATGYFWNCLFQYNYARNVGAALYLDPDADVTMINCIAVENIATNQGSTAYSEGRLSITNSILWDDGMAFAGKPPVVLFSNVRGGCAGTGNIEADPLFVDPANGDYHLQSGSPCIDAGNSDALPFIVVVDADGQPRYLDDPGKPDLGVGQDNVIDIGPYEFQTTSSAALTVVPTALQMGRQARAIVTNAIPEVPTWLLYSARGLGHTYIPKLQVEIDLLRPAAAAGPLRTSRSGDVVFYFRPPVVQAERDLWLQAVQYGTATNYVGTRLVRP